MQDDANLVIPTPKQAPWNKGKLIGTKPPLRQEHGWAIRTMLQVEPGKRDLAMFNLAIDSKLRGCDVVAQSGSMMLFPMVTQLIERRCVRKRTLLRVARRQH